MCAHTRTKSCPMLCNPMDCSPPGFSAHGTLQARILEWVAISHSWCLKGFPDGSVVKNPPANAGYGGDMGLIPGSVRSPEGGNGNPFQYSCLGNPTGREAWPVTVHGVSESDTTEHAQMHEGLVHFPRMRQNKHSCHTFLSLSCGCSSQIRGSL